MAKAKPSFICQSCGAVYTRWQGKCESCGEWNTVVEENASGGIGGGPQRGALYPDPTRPDPTIKKERPEGRSVAIKFPD